MIYFLSTCDNCMLLRICYLIKIFMNILFIILPIGLIVFITIDFAKCVIANKEDDIKRNKNIVIKRILYSIALFFVPTIVNITMSLVDKALETNNMDTFSACWTNATKEKMQTCSIEEQQNNNDDEQNNTDINNPNNNGNNQPDSNENNQPDYKPPSQNNNYTIYVGDSRTVGMCKSVNINSNSECIAETGQAYSWLKNTALSKIYSSLNKHKNANLVINMGVNNLGTTDKNAINSYANNYAKLYNEIAKKYPESKVIIVSVGVVSNNDLEKQKKAVNKGLLYSVIQNTSVETFNNAVKSKLSGSNISYCDINKSLKNKYQTTNDGLHYTSDTYKLIYSEIQNCL